MGRGEYEGKPTASRAPPPVCARALSGARGGSGIARMSLGTQHFWATVNIRRMQWYCLRPPTEAT